MLQRDLRVVIKFEGVLGAGRKPLKCICIPQHAGKWHSRIDKHIAAPRFSILDAPIPRFEVLDNQFSTFFWCRNLYLHNRFEENQG